MLYKSERTSILDSKLDLEPEIFRTRIFQEEYLAFLKKHGAHFDEKYLWLPRSHRTLRDGSFEGRFPFLVCRMYNVRTALRTNSNCLRSYAWCNAII
jgi:hypothetical protein